jgi:hypothetical protein
MRSKFNFPGDLFVMNWRWQFWLRCTYTVWFMAVYFQFQRVVHFVVYDCDEQRYTQLNLQPAADWVRNFTFLWNPSISEMNRAYSERDTFQLQFWRRNLRYFTFPTISFSRIEEDNFDFLALFSIPWIIWFITVCFLLHWVVRFNTYSCDEQSCTQLFAFSD